MTKVSRSKGRSKGWKQQDSSEGNLCGEVTSPRTKSYKAKLSIDKCGWVRDVQLAQARCCASNPLFHAPPRTIRASYVYRRFYSINWNCTSPRKLQSFRQVSKGWRERNCLSDHFFFFFSHLSIYFCQVSNKREMVEIFYSKWYGIRGEDHLLSYLRQVDACSLFVFVIIRTPLGRQLIPFSQIFLILIPILLWLMSNLSNSKFFIDSGFYSSINETSDNFYYFFKREGLLKFSLNIYEVSYKVYP